MALSFCFCHSNLSLKIDYPRLALRPPSDTRLHQRSTLSRKGLSTEGFSQRVTRVGTKLGNEWSFVGGSRIIVRPRLVRFVLHRRSSGVYASWWASSQIASNVFTLGTVAVLPFYTLMVFAPKAELVIPWYLLIHCGTLVLANNWGFPTKKCMQSSIPYAVLGILYAYVLYLSWTPETMQLMFASKYWLPELPGIARMFSNEMTLASAWIHLLAVDLFAARQVFQDGLNNKIETRHSVSLCLLFCPVGIFTHFITAALIESARSSKHIM